jgi:acetoin utilization deacetylase AcuC-like enzyme
MDLSNDSTNDNIDDAIATFALIRPPGHHATTNLCGGYCYLNNVIICASYQLSERSALKCVIVDVDFHHGNGVEEILQRNSSNDWTNRCRYVSLHAHPEYPYYTTHLPTPLAKTVTAEEYLSLLRERLEGAQSWCENEILVLVSLGLDTFCDDPVGGFAGFTSPSDYFQIGGEIGRFVRRIKAKTCFLLEGGYVVEKLGECVEAVLRGFMHGSNDN